MQQVLQDRYRLTRHVARSGVADVYQAVDLTLDRRVAVKVLRPDAARDPERNGQSRYRLRRIRPGNFGQQSIFRNY